MSSVRQLIKLSSEFYALASEVTVFTFVPREALESIAKKGLLSASELIKDKKALKLARPKNEKKFIERVEGEIEDPKMKLLTEGVSGFFTLPDWAKITKKHNIEKLNLVPISINLSMLMKEEPKTKLVGVELTIYDEEMSEKEYEARRKELSLEEVINYTLQDPTELWEGYDITHTTHYASDVPHLIICPPNKKIDPKYIKL